MKKQCSTIIKGIFITGLALLFMFPAMAQREKGGGVITQDEVRQITEIVKPIRDQLEKQLTGNATYNNYIEDLKRIHASNSIREKSTLTTQVVQKYTGFFKELWKAAKVDEQSYQQRIRKVFPSDLGSLLQFTDFLDFSLIPPSTISRTIIPNTPPSDKCLDVCSIATGEITSGTTLIADAAGSWGNCFLRTNAWAASGNPFSATAAAAEANGHLVNNIKIPGTFVDDSRNLRVNITYDLRQDSTCLSALGGSYAETRLLTFQSNEALVVYAPIIWYAHASKNKSVVENYVLLKKNVALSNFWSHSGVISILGSGNWCFSDCNNIRWSICEEK